MTGARTSANRRAANKRAEAATEWPLVPPPAVRSVSQLLGDVNALQDIVTSSIADCERRVKEANDELHALYTTREGLSHALGRNGPVLTGASSGVNFR